MDKLYSQYLSGEKFSNSFRFKFDIQSELISRNNAILGYLKDKKVLHLGCVDHENLIGKESWLHEKIDKIATRCLGVDINNEGLEILRKMGFNDLVCGDITSENLIPEIVDTTWDYIVIGDVLEHIDHPIIFLEKIKKNYAHCIKNFIITVPNAFNWNCIKNTFKNIETINTDHRTWFSVFTISKILTLSKYPIDEVRLVNNGETDNRGFITRMLLKRYPQLRDTLFVRGSF